MFQNGFEFARIYYIHEIDGTMPYIQLKGEILGFETIGEGRQRRLIAHFSDGTGIVDLVWFQGIKFLVGKYKDIRNILYLVNPASSTDGLTLLIRISIMLRN